MKRFFEIKKFVERIFSKRQ